MWQVQLETDLAHGTPTSRAPMPTYHCTVTAGLLDAGKKAAIAKDITRIHSAVTGAA